MASHVSLSKIRKKNGQVICTVKTTVPVNGVPPGIYEHFAIVAGDPHGLSPMVHAMMLAGKTRHTIPKSGEGT